MDSKKNTTSPYPAEFRERAVQMVIDHLDSYASMVVHRHTLQFLWKETATDQAEPPH